MLVAGIGDKLRGDDGFGPRVVEELLKRELPEEVDVVDYGTNSFEALLDSRDYDFVIFVDAVDRGGEPGELYLIEPEVRSLTTEEAVKLVTASLHELDLERTLSLGKTLNMLPDRFLIVGCQPKKLSFSMELTDEVESSVRKAVDVVIREMKKFRGERGGCCFA